MIYDKIQERASINGMKTIIILLHIRLNSTTGNDGYEIQTVFKFQNANFQNFKSCTQFFL